MVLGPNLDQLPSFFYFYFIYFFSFFCGRPGVTAMSLLLRVASSRHPLCTYSVLNILIVHLIWTDRMTTCLNAFVIRSPPNGSKNS